VLDTLFEAGFNQNDFLMADIRSMTEMLEANLSKGKGIVGWGELATSDVKFRDIDLFSAFMSRGCGRYSKDHIGTKIAGMGEGNRANAQSV
jgi:hypothetical protein